MLVFLILGLILFIVGVGATIAYDKYKVYQAAQPARTYKAGKTKAKTLNDMNEEFLQKFKASVSKPKTPETDELLNKVQALKKSGRTSIRINQNGKDAIVGVDDLIKKLEQMKKNL
jgi:biotin-(acetyl-CoA carboxylase) ligase